MLPLAPGLFSTTTGCPSRSESLGPTVRAIMSMPVPGVYGTMNLIGCEGQAWAKAPQLRTVAQSATPIRKSLRNIDISSKNALCRADDRRLL
jgi:hypothetical protein